jgi:hypothetical protein
MSREKSPIDAAHAVGGLGHSSGVKHQMSQQRSLHQEKAEQSKPFSKTESPLASKMSGDQPLLRTDALRAAIVNAIRDLHERAFHSTVSLDSDKKVGDPGMKPDRLPKEAATKKTVPGKAVNDPAARGTYGEEKKAPLGLNDSGTTLREKLKSKADTDIQGHGLIWQGQKDIRAKPDLARQDFNASFERGYLAKGQLQARAGLKEDACENKVSGFFQRFIKKEDPCIGELFKRLEPGEHVPHEGLDTLYFGKKQLSLRLSSIYQEVAMDYEVTVRDRHHGEKTLPERLKERLGDLLGNRHESLPERLKDRIEDRRESHESLHERLKDRIEERRESHESLPERLKDRIEERRESHESLPERLKERIEDRRESHESLPERLKDRIEDRRESHESLPERLKERIEERRESHESLPERLKDRIEERRESHESLPERLKERIEERHESHESLPERLKERIEERREDRQPLPERLKERIEERREDRQPLPERMKERIEERRESLPEQRTESVKEQKDEMAHISLERTMTAGLSEKQKLLLMTIDRRLDTLQLLPPRIQSSFMNYCFFSDLAEAALDDRDACARMIFATNTRPEEIVAHAEDIWKLLDSTSIAQLLNGYKWQRALLPFLLSLSESTRQFVENRSLQQRALAAGQQSERTQNPEIEEDPESSEDEFIKVSTFSEKEDGEQRERRRKRQRQKRSDQDDDESIEEEELEEEWMKSYGMIFPEHPYEDSPKSEEDDDYLYQHSSDVLRWFYIYVFYHMLYSRKHSYARFTSSPQCLVAEEIAWSLPDAVVEIERSTGPSASIEEIIASAETIARRKFHDDYHAFFTEEFRELTLEEIKKDPEYRNFFEMLK